MSEDQVTILPHEIESMFEFAIEGLIKGYSQSDLALKLKENWMNAPSDEIDRSIRRAIKAIKEETLVDIEKIIPLHIEDYEQIYQEADRLRSIPLKVQAMRGKEKLVGLHREINSVEIHNEVNIEVDGDPQYDLSKLSEPEQKRLEELMQKIDNQEWKLE